MIVRECTQNDSVESVEDFKNVISGNSDVELDQVLNKITNCIDNIEDHDNQLESFFNLYEACEFKTI